TTAYLSILSAHVQFNILFTAQLRPLEKRRKSPINDEVTQWLEHEFPDQKVYGSNPTSGSQLSLPRLEQPGSSTALVLPSGGMAIRNLKGATAELCVDPNLPDSTVTQCLEHEFTEQKVHGSNPTSGSRLSLPRLEQPGSSTALVLPSGGMAIRNLKGATAELCVDPNLPHSTLIEQWPERNPMINTPVILPHVLGHSARPKTTQAHSIQLAPNET
ncbi:hypothetical protein T265_13714, partial [Opisthorchis viverrini]